MLTATFFDGLSRVVRFVSIAAVLFIVAGLIGFLTDEVRDTSKVQSTVQIPDPGDTTAAGQTVTVDITQPAPPKDVEAARQQQHTSGREFIDDVGDVLMGPVNWLAKGSDGWVKRLLYSAIALIFYGALLQMLADYIRRLGDEQRRLARNARDAAAAEERRRSGSYQSPA